MHLLDETVGLLLNDRLYRLVLILFWLLNERRMRGIWSTQMSKVLESRRELLGPALPSISGQPMEHSTSLRFLSLLFSLWFSLLLGRLEKWPVRLLGFLNAWLEHQASSGFFQLVATVLDGCQLPSPVLHILGLAIEDPFCYLSCYFGSFLDFYELL